MKITRIALALAFLFTATGASFAQSHLRSYTHIASSRADSGQASPGSGVESQR